MDLRVLWWYERSTLNIYTILTISYVLYTVLCLSHRKFWHWAVTESGTVLLMALHWSQWKKMVCVLLCLRTIKIELHLPCSPEQNSCCWKLPVGGLSNGKGLQIIRSAMFAVASLNCSLGFSHWAPVYRMQYRDPGEDFVSFMGQDTKTYIVPK